MENTVLKEIVVNYIKEMSSRSFFQSIKKRNEKLIDLILIRTSYLNPHVKFNERIYHIVNDLYKPVLCCKCKKNKAKFNTYERGYRYCSMGCNSTGPNRTLSIKLRKDNYNLWKNRLENIATILNSKNDFIKTGILELKCCACNKIYKRRKAYTNNCPSCSKKGISKAEKDVLSYVKSIYNGKIFENKKKIIKNTLTNNWLELDIWLPELRKAIEYNGEYWHNSLKRKLYDSIKMEQCKKNNIDVLVIKEKNWIKNKENELIKIDNFLKIKIVQI